MRISFLSHEFPPIGGGASTALNEISLILAKQGHEIQILTPALKGSQGIVRDTAGREIIRLQSERKRPLSPSVTELLSSLLSLRFRTQKWLVDFRPDILVAFFAFPAGLAALPLAQELKVPLAVSIRGSDIPGFSRKRWGLFNLISPLVLKPVWRHADVIIANGMHLERLARAFAPCKRLMNAPNGVDIEKFYPSLRKTSYGPVRLLFVGQLVERKRLLLLLESLRYVKRNGVELTVVGSGPLEKEAKQVAKRLAEKSTVTFLGYCDREEMPRNYREHDILVHLSKSEGISNVLLEGLSSGLGILASSSAVNELEVKKAGIIIDNINVKNISQVINKFVEDKDFLFRCQTNARQQAEAFSWEQTANRFLLAFNQCLSNQEALH